MTQPTGSRLEGTGGAVSKRELGTIRWELTGEGLRLILKSDLGNKSVDKKDQTWGYL